MDLRLVIKIGSYRLLCPKENMSQAIDFVSQMRLFQERNPWREPSRYVPDNETEIKFELIPDCNIEEIPEADVVVKDQPSDLLQ